VPFGPARGRAAAEAVVRSAVDRRNAMQPIAWFEDIRLTDVAAVGGKGANRGELTAAGLPVPPGFVINAALP
jgi:hypothetical protein